MDEARAVENEAVVVAILADGLAIPADGKKAKDVGLALVAVGTRPKGGGLAILAVGTKPNTVGLAILADGARPRAVVLAIHAVGSKSRAVVFPMRLDGMPLAEPPAGTGGVTSCLEASSRDSNIAPLPQVVALTTWPRAGHFRGRIKP